MGHSKFHHDLFCDAWLKGGKMKTGEDDAEYATQMSGLYDLWNLLHKLSAARRVGEDVELGEIKNFLEGRDNLLREQIEFRNKEILSKHQPEKRQKIENSLEMAAQKAIKERSVWTAFLKFLKMSGIPIQLPEDYRDISQAGLCALLDLTRSAVLNQNMKAVAQLASVARANAMIAQGFSAE